jgi:hypothetical protein
MLLHPSCLWPARLYDYVSSELSRFAKAQSGAPHLLIQQRQATAESEAARRAEAMLKRQDHYEQLVQADLRLAIWAHSPAQRGPPR